MLSEVFRRHNYAEVVKYVTDIGIDLDVFDSMEGELTQAHINDGTLNNCRECPMALALNAILAEHRDKIGHSLVAEVNRLYVLIHTTDTRKCVLMAELSGLLEEWIDNYDAGKKLPPGRIYIEKNGFVESIEGGRIQRWCVGIDVPDTYYIDPEGEDNTVNWGV